MMNTSYPGVSDEQRLGPVMGSNPVPKSILMDVSEVHSDSEFIHAFDERVTESCLLYTSPSPRDRG